MSTAVTVVVDLDGGSDPEPLGERLRAHMGAQVQLVDAADLDGSSAHPAIAAAEHVWFLPAGAEPEPAALPALLAALSAAESLGAVGAALLSAQPAQEPRLLSAGVSTTRGGLRVNPVSAGETDDGQYARREDVLAVDLPGLLVRADLVRRIGLPSPRLSPAYRGIEYCRRIRAAGHRTALVPGARVRIADPHDAYISSARPPRSAQQLRDENRYRLSVVRRVQALPLLLWLVLLQLLGGIGALLANDPVVAGRWFSAAAALPSDLRSTRALRRTFSGRDAAGPLYARADELRIVRRELRGASGEGAAEPADDASESEEPSAARPAAGLRGLLLHPLTSVLLVLAAVSGLALHTLVGPGRLSGGAIPNLDIGFTAVLERILTPVSHSGLGSLAAADPALTVLAVLSLPFGGDLDLSVRVLWFAALPLAALIMYACAGRITPVTGIRALLGLLWACSPALLVALAEGRAGTVLSWLCAPAACWALDRAIRRRSPGAAAGAGLSIAVVLAGSPALAVPVLVLLLAVVLRVRRAGLLWTVIPPLALLGPWLIWVVGEPDALLADVGLPFDFAVPASYELALGHPAAPKSALLEALLPAAVVPWTLLGIMAPLLVAGVLALTRLRNSLGLLALSVGLYCAGLVGGIVETSFGAGLTADGLIASYPGDSLLLMGLGAAGIVAAALWPLGFDRLSRLRDRVLRVLVPVTALLVLGLFTAQALLVGMPLSRTSAPVLPAFAAERASGPLGQRTLVLSERGGELYGELADTGAGSVVQTGTVEQAALLRSAPGDRRPVELDAADLALATAIGRLTAGDGADVRDALRELGVGFVVVRAESSDALGRQVAVSPGLIRLGDSGADQLWQVQAEGAPISFASVVHPDGTAEAVELLDGRAQLPAGDPDRLLVLAERTGLSRAHIDGDPLPAAESGWRSAFALPADGGELVLSRSRAWHTAAAAGGLGLLLVSALVAVPFGRSGRR